MVLRWDELRKTISRRTIDFRAAPAGHGHLLAVVLELAAPLSPRDADAVLHAGHQAANAPIEGVIGPRLVEVTDRRITILLDPVSNGALRLDTLLGALAHHRQGLGGPLAASIAITAAGLLQQIHDAPGFEAPLRVHGEVHKGAIMLAPGGSVAVLGPGLPPINAILLPPLTRDVDRFRFLSPEAARGEPLDRRADVYSLGVLYYELLTGKPYLANLTAALVCQRAIEGQPPLLPRGFGASRPGLVPLFQRVLAPDRDQRFSTAAAFVDAIYDELDAAALAPGSAEALSAMLRDAVPSDVGRGPMALLTAEHDTATLDALLERSVAPTAPEPPASAPSSGPVPSFGDWGAVLEHEVTGINKVPQIAAAAAAEFAQAPPPPSPSPPSSVSPSTPPKRRPSSASAAAPRNLPLPAPEAGPAPVRPPVLDDAPFEALSQDVMPAAKAPRRPPPPVVIEEGSSIGTLLWIAVGVVALIGLGVAIATRSGEAEIDESMMTVVDAGAAPDVADPTPAVPSGTAQTNPPPPPPSADTAGYLSVMSTPSGATVELDDGFVGETPLVLRHTFENRAYRVRILADGHAPWEKIVRPDERRSISVVATLAPD